jgi:MFS family permease
MKKFSKKRSEKKLKHHSRRISIKESIYNSIKLSLGDHYIKPFAIAINSSNSLVAMITSITGIFGPISQLIASKRLGKYKRTKVISRAVLIEAFTWFIFALLGILYLLDIQREILPFALIILFSITTFFANYGHPAWFSLMGETVDKKNRGRWFSKRTTISSFILVIFAISAALGLEYLKKIGHQHFGFAILFFLAFLARLECSRLFLKQFEKNIKKKKPDKETFLQFIRNIGKTNFGKFTLFRGMFAISISISSSIIAIYLLRTLNFDYVSYILISLAGTLFTIILLNIWGKIADKYGNYKVLALTSIFIPITPLLWIISSSKIYLFLVPAVLGGTSWAGFIMASTNYIYLNTNNQNQEKHLSYMNIIIGIGIFLGASISALLLKILNTKFIEPIILIFLISFILRIITTLIWIPKLKDDNNKKELKGIGDFRKIIIKEAKPTLREDFHEIVKIKNYLKEK